MPDHKTMREHPHLQKFGSRLADPKIWHLNRRSVAGGLAIGLFFGFMPIIGQIFIACALAILFRVNLPIAFMGVWISNPLTFAPMFFFAYKIGAWILGIPVGQYGFDPSWEWLSTDFLAIWQPLLLGSFICGTVSAAIGVVFVRIGWRIVVVNSWLQRRRTRNNGL
jgi:hypothetical protein